MGEPHNVLRDDPAMAPLIAEHGELSIEPAEDPFERLVTSVVRQQLAVAAADAIEERLYEHFDVTPTEMRSASIDGLRDVGVSERKGETIQNIAIAFDERDYSRESFDGRSDEAVIDELTDISGIGPWTAKMFCMFALGREDVFPVEDLGIRKGMQTVFDDEMERSAMVARAERWQPYRSIASLYLWRVVD
ncbi:DNA-3-methyladenine glycosylase 2 family protein [Halorhabdus sp. BNX81]|uniref:DNA-3-methyladenine glycosylase family protein n=1 Tax=Halorhabdus sp. BNX81 TaxID=2980181 RepID=UPI0023DD49C6|nr:DNA-3-methyladenine glycosylase 2 family protein [Halorhabdus sp. BNX81]WEL21341.1 DNA-3-methyladenine glycosylase II [Halorhabdus sp. BNX81]